jgi:CheY-like chemotaxis protein
MPQHGVRSVARSAVKEPKREGEVRAATPPVLILVVDDYAVARELYSGFLRSAGFRVEEAGAGPEAVEKAVTQRPRLILMDLSMPGMDGLEVIRRLRADPRTASCRIVVVTGAAYVDGARKAKQAGCDAYLVKPCLPETLLGVVRGLLDESNRHPTSAQR